MFRKKSEKTENEKSWEDDTCRDLKRMTVALTVIAVGAFAASFVISSKQ